MRRPRRGFTLIEVLVALAIMAVLAALAWRGVDAMLRARDGSQRSLERTARLGTILVQWQQDFDALYDSQVVPPLAFNGRRLLMTRTQGDGVMLVAWSLDGTRWQRWTSAPTTRAAALQESWMHGQQLLGTEAGHVTLLDDVSEWQLYYYRGNGWANAQSSGELVTQVQGGAGGTGATGGGATGGGVAPVREALPDGVRLVVNTAGTTLTRDIALAPKGL